MTGQPIAVSEQTNDQTSGTTKYYLAVQLRYETDDWLREYAENVTPILRRYGGRYLARTATIERVEGDRDLPTLFAIAEWPSKQAFDQFFADPEYQKYKKLRRDHSSDELIIVAGEDVAVNLGYIEDDR